MDRIAGKVAIGEIRRGQIFLKGADVGRMDRLDAEPADRRVHETDVDIVLLGAGFGLGVVLDPHALAGRLPVMCTLHGFVRRGILGLRRAGEHGQGGDQYVTW